MVSIITGGLLIGGGALLAVGVVPIMMGFGAAGIAAGSVAAGIQAGIGSVAAGSTFATATSLGMTGAFSTTAITGAISAGSGLLLAFFK
jgi:hypothetical protein